LCVFVLFPIRQRMRGSAPVNIAIDQKCPNAVYSVFCGTGAKLQVVLYWLYCQLMDGGRADKKVKVKGNLVQALRLCTGRTVHRGVEI